MHLKTIIILVGLSFSIIASAQDTILIKGYVIGENQTLPKTSVINARNNIQTETNDKGIFKIKCSIGDTLIFKNKSSFFAQEEYIVKDNSLVIIELVEPIRFDDSGKKILHGFFPNPLILKHFFQLSTSMTDNLFSLGYSYYPESLIRTHLFLGMRLSQYQNNESIFPYIGYVSYFYRGIKITNDLYLTLLSPKLEVGYLIVNNHSSENGFGYEIGTDLIYSRYHDISLRISGSYNSCLSPNGAFMLNLNIGILSKMNTIPKFISKKKLK